MLYTTQNDYVVNSFIGELKNLINKIHKQPCSKCNKIILSVAEFKTM